jgi:rubredoxin
VLPALENYGDELQGIFPGLSFTDLPEDYCCGVCGEGKEHFKQLIKIPVETG